MPKNEIFWIEKLNMYKVQVGSRGRGGTPYSQSSFSLLGVDGLAKFEFKP